MACARAGGRGGPHMATHMASCCALGPTPLCGLVYARSVRTRSRPGGALRGPSLATSLLQAGRGAGAQGRMNAGAQGQGHRAADGGREEAQPGVLCPQAKGNCHMPNMTASQRHMHRVRDAGSTAPGAPACASECMHAIEMCPPLPTHMQPALHAAHACMHGVPSWRGVAWHGMGPGSSVCCAARRAAPHQYGSPWQSRANIATYR